MKYRDKDIQDWPKSWAYFPDDIDYGKGILDLFSPFINDLKESGLSQKTINTHIDNLWLLGGYLIKQINTYAEDKKKEPLFLLYDCLDSGDGPYIHDLSDYEQDSFDRTCRKFYKYLLQNELKK